MHFSRLSQDRFRTLVERTPHGVEARLSAWCVFPNLGEGEVDETTTAEA